MRIALAQMKMDPSIEANFRKTLKLIRSAAIKEADLIVFPEIQLTPFFPQSKDLDVSSYVMDYSNPYFKGIKEACREYGVLAVPNLYIEENGKRYDMSILIGDDGNIIGRQKMVHIAQCEHFYEQSYYEPSEEGFFVFETRLGKIGIVVCFDRHYPESIRTESLRGADLIVIPTANTTNEPSELFLWEVRVQAFQNSVNIAMCNRTGVEDQMEFSGESVVCDYNGNLVAQAGSEEELLIADIDIEGASETRMRKPYTSLRRTELYE